MEMQELPTLYGRIADDLRQAIRRGVYLQGDRLPSLRGICQQYEVSLGTAVEALGQLQDEGWVVPRDRSGFFVAAEAVQALSAPRQNPISSQPVSVNVGGVAMSVIGNARKPGITNLGAGVPDAGLLPLQNLSRSISSVARRHYEVLAGYDEVEGVAALRRQISRLMGDAGVECSPEEVLITNGCQEALMLALQCVTSPGDVVAVESPAFFGLLQAMEALQLKAVEIPVQYPGGVSPQAVQQVLQQHSVKACLLTPTHHNPMGVVMPTEDKQQIVEMLADAGVPLIEDDIFGFLGFGGKRPPAAKSFDTGGNVILCSSFSKAMAPGLRLGWMLPGKFMEQARRKKFLVNLTTSPLPQLAMAEYLGRGVFLRGLRRMTEQLQHRMWQMRKDLADHFPADTRITHPEGGLFLWLELPDQLDAQALYEQAFQKGIGILPGGLFSPSGNYQNHIRLTFASVSPEQSRKAIQEIAALLPGLPKASGPSVPQKPRMD